MLHSDFTDSALGSADKSPLPYHHHHHHHGHHHHQHDNHHHRHHHLHSDFTDSALGSADKSPLPYGNFQLRESTMAVSLILFFNLQFHHILTYSLLSHPIPFFPRPIWQFQTYCRIHISILPVLSAYNVIPNLLTPVTIRHFSAFLSNILSMKTALLIWDDCHELISTNADFFGRRSCTDYSLTNKHKGALWMFCFQLVIRLSLDHI